MMRQKYYNVLCIKVSFINNFTAEFDCCRDAAIWLHNSGISASTNAARVGLSGVLTGKREYYRGMIIKAERNY